MVALMVLPAFARWQLGVNQSLSLRYHYSTLVALTIVMLPLLSALYERIPARRMLLGGITACWLFTQLFATRHFEYFSGHGYEHRMYVQELTAWNVRLEKLREGGKNIPYEAVGTPDAGLQPAHPATLTPGRHPEQIYAVLKWLRS